MTKHIFIVNPAAGKGSEAADISDVIRDACEACNASYEIHLTTAPGDATDFTRKFIEREVKTRTPDAKKSNDEYRFYACGGDGTLSDVISGAIDESLGAPIPGVSVGCIPTGTGNDFTRNFSQSEFFLDVTKQLLADPMTIDCFKVDGNSADSDRYGVNMVNIGFDCDVVCTAAELKKRRFFPKSLAYVVGVFIILKKNLGQTMTVISSDGSTQSREFELVAVANGGFCGGGFHSAPKSRLDDGLLDLSLIKKVNRRDFLRLVGHYKNGTHLNTRLGKRVVNYSQTDRVTLKFPKAANVCVDGEIFRLNEVALRVVPRAISFLVPVGSVYSPYNMKKQK